VAVLGVDNDEVLCSLSPPPLSSVILNPRRAGWEAAVLLDKLMRGSKLRADDHVCLIPPVGVATRQSTDILAVDDPKIASALRFIREHACEGIKVGDVLAHNPMARRVLEMRFQKLIGRTPRQELLRVKLSRVKELLVGTRFPVWQIAERVGLDANHLSVVFRQATGVGPRAYRERYGRPDR
jgi:LacI family transcriptional regulator